MRLKALWNRPEARFLILYGVILATLFTVIALKPVNDRFVVPYTSLVAQLSGEVLAVLGEDITIDNCLLRSPRFAVTIYNGCNGLITSIIFIAGVLSFPARPRHKVIGVVGGLLAIQVVNLIRIVALFFTGVYLPSMFASSHIVVWQSIVILSGVALWIVWAARFAKPAQPPRGAGGDL